MHVKHVVTNEVQPAQSLTTCGGPKSPKTWDVATKSLRYLVVLLIPSSRSPFKMHGDNLFRTRILHRHIFLFMGSSSFTGTSSLHGHIFPFIGTSSLHGRIFPFIGTPSPSWAHLPLRDHIHHGNAFCAEMVIVLVIVENRKHFRKNKFHDITPCNKYRTSDNIPVLSIQNSKYI